MDSDLAGGRGSRARCDKASLLIEDSVLIEHAAQPVGAASVEFTMRHNPLEMQDLANGTVSSHHADTSLLDDVTTPWGAR